MIQNDLPTELSDWCAGLLGAFDVRSTHHQPHGEAQIWRLAAQGQTVYLKSHRRAQKWAMEVHAYEHWLPMLGADVPQLLGALESTPRALLISELAGAPMDRLQLTTSEEHAVWQAAGSFLARLHALPAGTWFGMPIRDGSPRTAEPPHDPVVYMRSSLEQSLRRATDATLLSTRERDVIERAMLVCDIFAGEQPRPCHHDYQPRNWIVANNTWRGAIDFEHTFWDVPLIDLGYWWDHTFLERPDLETAFFAGYGARLDPTRQRQLDVVRVLGGVGQMLFGRQVGVETLEAQGHATLERIAPLFG